MPFKLIGTIILLVLITIFCGFNLEEANKCDINLIFHVFEKVPVFLTVLTSFLAGIVVMLPFAFFRKRSARILKKRKRQTLLNWQNQQNLKKLTEKQIQLIKTKNRKRRFSILKSENR